MDIAATLRSYDGKRVAPFRAVAEAVRDAPESAVDLLVDIAASDEMELQVGATWVLKHLAQQGVAPRGRNAAALLSLLGRPIAPDALLHILQTLPHMHLDADGLGGLRDALLTLTGSKRTFIRTWAYNGLGVLAARDPSLRPEVERLFDQAVKTDSAAVKVRIRHARSAMARCRRGQADASPEEIPGRSGR
ncbi:MAG: hypothetical protein OXK77_06990 [Gemmatimonadota bacterium]|nr:hypothetical protein [Gemmatimonadota bacterium]MDE2864895.1 hypothetical protein [Gemmatimonadota bacterium]